MGNPSIFDALRAKLSNEQDILVFYTFKVVKPATRPIKSQGSTDLDTGCGAPIGLTSHLPTLNSSSPTSPLPVNLTLSPPHKGS